jgi:hypothetical protein
MAGEGVSDGATAEGTRRAGMEGGKAWGGGLGGATAGGWLRALNGATRTILSGERLRESEKGRESEREVRSLSLSLSPALVLSLSHPLSLCLLRGGGRGWGYRSTSLVRKHPPP